MREGSTSPLGFPLTFQVSHFPAVYMPIPHTLGQFSIFLGGILCPTCWVRLRGPKSKDSPVGGQLPCRVNDDLGDETCSMEAEAVWGMVLQPLNLDQRQIPSTLDSSQISTPQNVNKRKWLFYSSNSYVCMHASNLDEESIFTQPQIED